MIKKLTDFFVSLVKKYLPDAFTIALMFLVALFIVGMTAGGQSFEQMLVYSTPSRYARAVKESMVSCAGIAMQFPIYASIMGMMKSAGVTEMIADAFIGFADKGTFPLFTFLSAGLINFLVPGGGSQWAVQGPIMVPAGMALGVEPV